jgi:hypothetical protein
MSELKGHTKLSGDSSEVFEDRICVTLFEMSFRYRDNESEQSLICCDGLFFFTTLLTAVKFMVALDPGARSLFLKVLLTTNKEQMSVPHIIHSIVMN